VRKNLDQKKFEMEHYRGKTYSNKDDLIADLQRRLDCAEHAYALLDEAARTNRNVRNNDCVFIPAEPEYNRFGELVRKKCPGKCSCGRWPPNQEYAWKQSWFKHRNGRA
jgi:hypothetical protein